MLAARFIFPGLVMLFGGWMLLSTISSITSGLEAHASLRAQTVNCLEIRDDRAAMDCLRGQPRLYHGG